MKCYSSRQQIKNSGFTLIELVVGIVVLAISFAVIISFVMPTTVQSANQVHQIRAAELGQSLMNEILGKAFDEQSDHVGGVLRCGEPGLNACSAVLRAEEANRADFDDVDDYDGLDESGVNIQDSLGNAMGTLYQGYRVEVDVIYDSNYDGVDDGAVGLAKLIQVVVTLPSDEQVRFATYKVNF